MRYFNKKSGIKRWFLACDVKGLWGFMFQRWVGYLDFLWLKSHRIKSGWSWKGLLEVI